MVDDSFALHVLEVVDSIPAGRVLSYGDIAAILGSRAARAVGNVMKYGGGEHPWWRVIRSDGSPPTSLEFEARPHYDTERTPLKAASTEWGYRVDYAEARWNLT